MNPFQKLHFTCMCLSTLLTSISAALLVGFFSIHCFCIFNTTWNFSHIWPELELVLDYDREGYHEVTETYPHPHTHTSTTFSLKRISSFIETDTHSHIRQFKWIYAERPSICLHTSDKITSPSGNLLQDYVLLQCRTSILFRRRHFLRYIVLGTCRASEWIPIRFQEVLN